MPGFANRPDYLLHIDKIARAYSMHPAQVLELSPFELGFASLCAEAAAEKQARQIQAVDGALFPVVVVGGV